VETGKKRFQLFSPAHALRMYTVGRIQFVHPNGRINYAHEPTAADGRSLEADAAMFAADRVSAAEAAVEHWQSQVDGFVSGAEIELERAESELEEAMNELLEAEACTGGRPSKTRNRLCKERPSHPPSNFSRVDLSEGREVIRESFPEFPLEAEVSVDLSAGQCLYLPTGWFHNVTSLGPANDAPSTPECPFAHDGGHMAFNYWYYPPDTQDFHKPYSSPFWEKDWAARGDVAVHEAMGMR
jgi:Cupin-like domain